LKRGLILALNGALRTSSAGFFPMPIS
jgi:hypothetical protein